MMDIGKAIERLEADTQDSVYYFEGCVEPGYDDAPMIAGNWNPLSQETNDKWEAVLEANGISLEWNDEWVECEGCNKAVRCQPNSYSWLPYYVFIDDCTVLCGDCILEDPEDEYIPLLINNPGKANIFNLLELKDFGFQPYNGRYETGWHPGQNDEPSKVMEEIHKELPSSEVVFEITSKGQFGIYWTAFYRKSRKN